MQTANRLQESTVARLSAEYGRVHVREGFADGHVVVTTPTGACWNVTEDGISHRTQPNYSINWNEE